MILFLRGERRENSSKYDVTETLWRSFREQALQFCACDDFDAGQFLEDARQQAENLKGVVDSLFEVRGTRYGVRCA
jgi:hypothetical protein